MKYYKYLYFSDDIKDKTKYKIKKELQHCSPFLYIIYIPEDSDNIEFMNAAFLKFSYYRKSKMTIIGICRGKDEACKLVLKLTNECLEHLGKVNYKEYLSLRVKTKDFSNEV